MLSRISFFLLSLVALFSLQSLAFSLPPLNHRQTPRFALSNRGNTARSCPANQDPNFCNGDTHQNGDQTSIACKKLKKRSLDVRDPKGKKGAVSCNNCAKIKKAKAKFQGCDPTHSKGFRSSHNCPGKSYLCVVDNVATCYTGGSVKSLNAENGECFL